MDAVIPLSYVEDVMVLNLKAGGKICTSTTVVFRSVNSDMGGTRDMHVGFGFGTESKIRTAG